MTDTPLKNANLALDDSMSTIVLAASSLATICESLLNGRENEHGAPFVSKSNREALTFLAIHLHDLVRDHVALWDSFAELRAG